jgi:hypothetical protein
LNFGVYADARRANARFCSTFSLPDYTVGSGLNRILLDLDEEALLAGSSELRSYRRSGIVPGWLSPQGLTLPRRFDI